MAVCASPAIPASRLKRQWNRTPLIARMLWWCAMFWSSTKTLSMHTFCVCVDFYPPSGILPGSTLKYLHCAWQDPTCNTPRTWQDVHLLFCGCLPSVIFRTIHDNYKHRHIVQQNNSCYSQVAACKFLWQKSLCMIYSCDLKDNSHKLPHAGSNLHPLAFHSPIQHGINHT